MPLFWSNNSVPLYLYTYINQSISSLPSPTFSQTLPQREVWKHFPAVPPTPREHIQRLILPLNLKHIIQNWYISTITISPILVKFFTWRKYIHKYTFLYFNRTYIKTIIFKISRNTVKGQREIVWALKYECAFYHSWPLDFKYSTTQ